jgi:hypothetical protein
MASAKTFTIYTKFAVKNGFTGPVLQMAKGADKMAARVDAAKKTLGHVGKGLATVGKFAAVGAGAAVAAGAAVWSLANASQQAADDIQNTAGALGMSTDQLQRYRYVAIQAGMSTEDMDGALAKLSKGLGEESGAMDEALYQIGLSAQDLRDAGPDKTLELIAGGFQNLQDPTQKAAVATALFGKSSIRMVNALSGGPEAIKALGREADKVGYVMGGDMLENAGAVNQEMDKLGATAVGLRNRLAAKAMPGLKSFVQTLQSGIAPGGKLSGIIDGVTGLLGKVGDFSGGGLSAIFDFIPKLTAFAGDLLTALKPVLDPIMAMVSPLLKIFENLMPTIIGGIKLISALLAPIMETIKFILDGLALITTQNAPAVAVAGSTGKYGNTPLNAVPMSPATSTISNTSTSTSTVGINVNAPPGTTVNPGKGAPPVTLNTGTNTSHGKASKGKY